MNLLENLTSDKNEEILDNNAVKFEMFKRNQYDKLEWFSNLCVDYISKVGGGYLTRVETIISNELRYEDLNGYSMTRVQVKIKDGNNKKVFLSFSLPTLIENNFFYLNGSYYSPTCYILDNPISIKKKSLKLTGLFNSITVFTKDKRVIFCGHNIPINYFLQLFIDDDDKIKDFLNHFKIGYIKYTEQDLKNYFSGILNCDKDITIIKNTITTLFLDDYTSELYKTCYKLQTVDISSILLLGIEMSKKDEKISFVDLNYKRLVFMELILRPIFQKCSDFALRVNKGYKANEMNISNDEILKYFTMKLKNKFLYDVGNLFSGIATHKVSMMNPGSDNAPSEIASVHPSHIGKICQINISNQNPGEVISIIPGIKINKLGLFIQ